MTKLIIGSAILFVALMFGLVEMRHERQLSIIAVLDQASKAKVQIKKLKDGRTFIIHPNNPQFSLKVYTQQLSQISTVECPEPFQLVWLNMFRHGRDQRHHLLVSVRPLSSLFQR